MTQEHTSPETFAEAYRREAELLRRRFVFATRPRSMTMEEAADLCRRVQGEVDGEESGGRGK